MSSEECTTTLSKKRVPVKALVLLLIFTFGSFSVSGTVLPFAFSDARRATGSFVLTISPSSVMVHQSMNVTSTVSIVSIQGYSGTVSLAAQSPGGGLKVTFSQGNVIVPARGTATSTITIQAAKNASIGTYTIIITGISAVGRRVVSSSTILTVVVNLLADFDLYAYPYSINVVAGMTNSTNIILDSKNGFGGSVTLSATMPFGFLGVMGGQNPMTLTPGGTSYTTLQVSATTSTLLGKYNITVTGVNGNVSHTCVLVVNVVDPVPESLTLSGFSVLSPTGLTLFLRNNGNTPITLQAYTISDGNGASWALANWTGTTVLPGSSTPATIFIGVSCESCTYSGIPFAFQQFISGHTYTVTVTTKLNSQFTFLVRIP